MKAASDPGGISLSVLAAGKEHAGRIYCLSLQISYCEKIHERHHALQIQEILLGGTLLMSVLAPNAEVLAQHLKARLNVTKCAGLTLRNTSLNSHF